MHLLVNQAELSKGKSRDLFPLQCEYCYNIFYRPKHRIQAILSGDKSAAYRFCRPQCFQASNITKIQCECKQCQKIFYKTKKKKLSSKNDFCSSSCSAKYNNAHKTKGTRRSKLEAWLEENLSKQYPNLEIHYARKDAINSELDLYIPSLKLAFELNGIFHYEPIYGKEKLNQIQNNDVRKFQACLEKQIELCIIDTSQEKQFKIKKSQKYLNIITNIINSKNGAINENRTRS